LSIVQCAPVDDYVAYYLPFGCRRHGLVRSFTTLKKLLVNRGFVYCQENILIRCGRRREPSSDPTKNEIAQTLEILSKSYVKYTVTSVLVEVRVESMRALLHSETILPMFLETMAEASQ
jgi:hypothetical protein